MKKNFLYFCILLIVGLIICAFYATIRFDYTNDIIPPTTYHVRVNRFTKSMSIHEYHSCSTIDCKGTTNSYKIKLDNDEYLYLSNILKNHYSMNELVTALSYIGKDSDVFCTNQDDFYDLEEDVNHDGKVTYREIGDSRLYQIYKK